MNTDENPWLSFCMSTYKRPQFLHSQITSLLQQNFQNFEIVISDNDPETSGKTVAESFNDPRIQYQGNDENLGMIKSFNKSLRRSKGEYIVMITDDDPVYPDMASTLFHLTEKYPGYGMYMGGCDWFCTDAEIAGLYKLNIGTTSCLSNKHNLNYVQAYSADEFLLQFYSFKIFPHYL